MAPRLVWSPTLLPISRISESAFRMRGPPPSTKRAPMAPWVRAPSVTGSAIFTKSLCRPSLGSSRSYVAKNLFGSLLRVRHCKQLAVQRSRRRFAKLERRPGLRIHPIGRSSNGSGTGSCREGRRGCRIATSTGGWSRCPPSIASFRTEVWGYTKPRFQSSSHKVTAVRYPCDPIPLRILHLG